jgi:hypothetical protein
MEKKIVGKSEGEGEAPSLAFRTPRGGIIASAQVHLDETPVREQLLNH